MLPKCDVCMLQPEFPIYLGELTGRLCEWDPMDHEIKLCSTLLILWFIIIFMLCNPEGPFCAYTAQL